MMNSVPLQPIEPTTPAIKSPYEQTVHTTNPYGDYIGIPPPPPKRARRYLGVVLAIAILIFSAAGLFAWTYTYHVNTTQPTPIVRFVQVTPTAPLPTQQPTVDPNYTATDVINNFTHAGIRPSYIQYGQTVWSWTADMYYVSVHATSSATWTDDSACTGYCSPIDMGLWVYADTATAKSAYAQVGNDEATQGSIPMIGIPTEYIHGRCLLLGAPVNSVYDQVVQKYCV